MKLDNSETVIKIQMQKRLLAVLVAVLIALNYTTNLWSFVDNLTGIPRGAFTVFVLSIFLGFYLYHLLRKSQFVSYSDDEAKVVVRFYSLNIFDTKKNSFEVPKNQMVGFRIKRSLLNLKHEVFITQSMGKRLAHYPPFSITALSPMERDKLLKSLQTYSQQ